MSTSPPRPFQTVGARLSVLGEQVPQAVAGRSRTVVDDPDPQVTGATLRAHEARPGDLFGAMPGARVHGARFAAEAVAAGAVAVLTDPAGAALIDGTDLRVPLLVVEDPRRTLGRMAARIYGDPSAAVPVYGVTGTSGKTTTCFLLEAALVAQGLRVGLIGTVMTRIGGGRVGEGRVGGGRVGEGHGGPGPGAEVLPSSFTTPEAPDLQALLALMRERDVAAVAMEVSSHALALGRVGGTHFAVGAFTNLSQDHLDFHPDMEDYFEAKAALFDGRSRRAVVDIDDPYGRRLADRHRDAITVSSAGRPEAHWRVTHVAADAAGRQQLRIEGPGNRVLTADLAIPGRFNVANALTALVMVDAGGHDIERAAVALADVQVPGRMQRVDAGQDFLALVDYAHKPAALTAVLDAVRGSVRGRVIAVIGAGGDRDTGKRAMMGAATAERADLVIVTDDNPRSEEPADIRAAVLAGAHAADSAAVIREIGDRGAAVAAAVAAARSGDAVVIAGKGHETGQEIDGVKHPFSDVDVLRAALQQVTGDEGVAR